MLESAYKKTMEFIETTPKKERKKIGQFFTQPSIAGFMADLVEVKEKTIRVLDPGAGSGLLTVAVIDRICEVEEVENIQVDLYENNAAVINVLKENLNDAMDYVRSKGKKLKYNIIQENFITYNQEKWRAKDNGIYDVVISNPPYKKMAKDSEESQSMLEIVHGQPNIYFLFMAMACKLTKENGQLIFITPRSFTSGLYFREFRKYWLSNAVFTDIHIFDSRNGTFEVDSVLQEIIITKSIKTKENMEKINITSTSSKEFDDINKLSVPYSSVVNLESENQYILIPTNEEQMETMRIMNSFKYTLKELGFKFATGQVVDFRNMEFIRSDAETGTVPLIWACNFDKGTITHPVKKDKEQYIISNETNKKLVLQMQDCILVKRFTSKEENRRIQSAILLKEDFSIYDTIGIENHLNYIVKEKKGLEKEELWGLYAILNTTFIDQYYRILNGSTQVNASEMNSILFPDIKTIRKVGSVIDKTKIIDESYCDQLVRSICFELDEFKVM